MRWFFLVLLCSSLFASPKNFSEERENYFTTSTPYKIEPQVNPISGDLMLDELDFAVAGTEPLSLRRFYNHTASYEARSGGWRLNPETFAVANFTSKKQERFAAIGSESGSIISLSESNKNYRHQIKADAMHFQLGGQHHPLNLKICYREKRAHKKKFFTLEGEITDGTGTIRSFRSPKHCWRSNVEVPFLRNGNLVLPPEVWVPYQLPVWEERRPNGNILKYEYKGWRENGLYPRPYLLKGVVAYNADQSKVIGWLDFDYFQDKEETVHGIRVRGSDGRWVCLGNQSFDATLLHRVDAPNKPPTWYDYQHFSINKVAHPEGRYIRTEYNCQNKVAAQYAPLGPDGEECILAKYIYHQNATEIFDAENNKTIYHFDGNQKIIAHEVYNPDGSYLRSEKYTWDPTTGNLLKKVIEDGRGKPLLITSYQYDQNQNPIVEKIGDGSSWHTIHRTFSNDGFNLLLSESDRPGKITEYRYKPGTNLRTAELVFCHGELKKRSFSFYDNAACCIKTIVDDGTTEDPFNLTGVTYRKILEIVPKQNHPCFGLPQIVTEKTIDDAGQEMTLKRVVYTYAPSGQILQEEHYDCHGHYCYCIKNNYDLAERLISTQDAEGHITTFTYDANHNLTSTTSLHKEEITYDKANRPIKYSKDGLSKTICYDRLGRVLSEADFCGNTTHFLYDPLGHPIQIIHPDGATESREYDPSGNLTSQTDALGHVTTTYYDFRNKPTSIFYPDDTSEHFTYADWGALITHITREGLVETYEHDLFDNLTCLSVYDLEGNLLKCQQRDYTPFCKVKDISPEGVETTYCYDFAGRLIKEQCAEREIVYSYDPLGRLNITRQGDTASFEYYDYNNKLIEKSCSSDNKTLLLERYRYDQAGNCTHVIGCGGTTITTYDGQNLPTSITDPLGNTTTFTYHHKGCLQETITRPKGTQEIKRYDTRGRISQVTKLDAQGNLLTQTTYTYDRVGNCISTSHLLNKRKTITHSWEYDSCRRITRLLEADQKETRYFYDFFGRLKTTIKPSGRTLNQEYDALGRIKHFYGEGFDYHYSYNKDDLLLKAGATARHYDIYGQMTEELLDSGLKIINTYDIQGRRIGQKLPDGSIIACTYEGPFLKKVQRGAYTHHYLERNLDGQLLKSLLPIGNLSYQRDALGRIESLSSPFYTQKNRYDSQSNITYSSKNEDEFFYDYDPIDQLIQEADHAYGYDNLYNRIAKDGTTYSLNEHCQIESDGHANYEYDLDGNLIFDGKNHYAYDALDRLIRLNAKHFTYDAFHRRLSQTTLNTTIRYLWDGDNEIGAIDDQGKILELRILGEGLGAEIGTAILLELNGKPYLPIHDTQGSLATLINLITEEQTSYRYTAFGEELSSNTLSPWRFASKRTEDGLIYFGRRYYNPTLGRFITQDPEGFHDGPNLYAYVHNCPLTHLDLYGLANFSIYDCNFETKALPKFENSYDIKSTIGGIGHGIVDFLMGSLHDLQTAAMHVGSDQLGMSLQERIQMIDVVEHSQMKQMATIGSQLMGMLAIEDSNTLYQSCRSTTRLGLEIGSLAAGGYGLTKGLIAFNRFVRVPLHAVKMTKSLSFVERKGISLAGSRRAPLEYAPFQPVRNKTTIINNRTYVGHSLDRMQDRGFMPSVIENAIEVGRTSPTPIPGRIEYYDPLNKLRVIVQDNERVISVIPTRSN